jgi:hypothetical protein
MTDSRRYTDRVFGNLGASAPDAANCPLCNAPWDSGTDHIGRLVAIHPVTRCIPRPDGQIVECAVCEREIRLAADPGRKTVFWCSEECRLELKERKRLRDLACDKRYQQKQARLSRIWRAA